MSAGSLVRRLCELSHCSRARRLCELSLWWRQLSELSVSIATQEKAPPHPAGLTSLHFAPFSPLLCVSSPYAAAEASPATGGAIGRLPDKATDLRAQTADDEEPKFMIRLADSLLQTFFASITVAFQAQPFIDSLKDLLRPILAPEPPDDGANGDGTGGGSGNTPNSGGNLGDLDADDPDESSPPGGGSSVVLRDGVGPLDRLAFA